MDDSWIDLLETLKKESSLKQYAQPLLNRGVI